VSRVRRILVLAVLAAAVSAGIASGASRVVGGDTIQVQTAPWTVYVQQTVGNQRFLCTGSVVDASHILTAAHCLFNDNGVLAPPSAFQVRAGVSNFSSPLASDLEQDRGVSSFRVHPGYVWSGRAAPDDVAVLALVSPLDLSGPAVQAVALPSPGATFPDGGSVGIAGFGRQNPTVAISGQLSWMTASVDAQGTCGISGIGLIPNNGVYLCAAATASAVCSGDSGSGLVTTGGTPVLVGVANAVTSGCGIGSHALFAYTGAPEILEFVQGNDHPPSAPRQSNSTFLRVGWSPRGTLVVGDTLTCSTGGWSDPQPKVSYSFVDASGGQVLQAGPRATFTIPAADEGLVIYCEVAVSNSGGTTLAMTDPTGAVKPPPQVRIVGVGPLAGTRGGAVSFRVTLVSPAGLHGKFAVCIAPPKSVAGRLCRSTVNADGEAATIPFTFSFRIKPGAPLGTTHVAISAVAGLSTATSTTLLRVS
jgi:hypothetical protein